MYALKGFLLYFTSAHYIMQFSLINYTSITKKFQIKCKISTDMKFQRTTAAPTVLSNSGYGSAMAVWRRKFSEKTPPNSGGVVGCGWRPP